MHIFRRLAVALALLAATDTFPQSLRFEQFTTHDGLISDEVYNLHQDRKGYIWAFTPYGAMKYDGTAFRTVLRNLPFSESFIYSIWENTDGRMWVANSRSNVFEIRNDSAILVSGLEKISADLRKTVSEIFQIFVDDSLNLYLITKNVSYVCRAQKHGYACSRLDLGIPVDVFFRVLEKNNNLMVIFNKRRFPIERMKLFLTDSLTIQFGDGNNWNRRWVAANTNGPPMHARQYGNNIYLSFYDKLVKLGKKKARQIPLDAIVLNFKRDQNGHLWVATYNRGLLEFDENDSLINSYYTSLTVNDVLPDNQGGIWFTTAGSGIFHCANLAQRFYEKGSPFSGGVSFVKTAGGTLYAGSHTGELACYVNGKFELLLKEGSQLTAFSAVSAGDRTYFSFRYGIGYMKKSDHRFDTKTIVSEAANSRKLFALGEDSLIYFNRKGSGLLVNGKVTQRRDFHHRTSDGALWNNQLYLGTVDGVYRGKKILPVELLLSKTEMPIINDTLEMPPELNFTKGISVSTLNTDSADRLWICTNGAGLFVQTKKKEVRHYTTADGLPSNVVHEVQFYRDQVLVCTNLGLFRSTITDDGHLTGFKQLFSGEVFQVAYHDGFIFAAGTNAFFRIEENVSGSPASIPVILDQAYVFGRAVPTNSLNNLRHDQNQLLFRFDVLSFSNRAVGLQFRLAGRQKDSGTVTGRRLRFQQLPPGKYRLSVFPVVPGENPQGIDVNFRIVPAVWQRTWFIVSVVLFSVAAIVVTLLILFGSYKRRREKSERAKKQLLEYKLIALKALVNPHFVSNCLSAIQLLILDSKLDAATKYIARFGQLVRKILVHSSRSVIRLNEELELAELYLELEQLRFEHRFDYQIVVYPPVDAANIYVPSLILNPILENAIWHGLLPLKDRRNGRVSIICKVNETDGLLNIIVEDNGIGRGNVTGSISNNDESRGTEITTQRLANINYLYNISTTGIDYEDLTGDDGMSAGTRVTIKLAPDLSPVSYE